MEDLSSWRGKEAKRCGRDGGGAQPPSGSTSPLSLAPPCPPSYSLQLGFLVLPVAKPGVRERQGWLLLIGFVLGQVQAIPAWSQGKGPILAEL